VVADSVFREALNDLLFILAKLIHPIMHTLDHLSLDGGVPLVEIGMEPGEFWSTPIKSSGVGGLQALKDFFCYIVYILRVVVPGLDD
jgi:hypothetical protein